MAAVPSYAAHTEAAVNEGVAAAATSTQAVPSISAVPNNL